MVSALREPVLRVEGLTVDFRSSPGQTTSAVRDVSFDLFPGEILAVVGESGAGKSTIGSAIIQLLDQGGWLTAGSIKLNGLELVGRSERELDNIRGRAIGTIFQNPSSALCPVVTIGDHLKRAIRRHAKMTDRAAAQRAIELLSQVGISDPQTRLKQYPHQFSGGMKQRIVIAIALAHNPQVIIADEPTTALDVTVQAEILNLIKTLGAEHGSGTILITHNMAVVSEVADRVAVMQEGRLVEIGSVGDLLAHPKQLYTKNLIAAVPRFDGPASRADGQHTVPRTPLLEVESLSVSYPTMKALFGSGKEDFKAVDRVSLCVHSGETLGLVGESGSGKSTVARALIGLTRVAGGSIKFRGREISGLVADRNLRKFCLPMQMVFQDPFSSLDPRQNVYRILAEPLRVHRTVNAAEIDRIVFDALDRVGLDRAAARRYPHQFSGGQRQRISIARALVLQPALLICDEPTSALDVSIQAQILNLLAELRQSLNLAMLFISHDLAVVRQVCDRVGVMRQGRLLEVGETDEVFRDPRDPYTIELIQRTPKFAAGLEPIATGSVC
jgi:peptide/nickel transport system ATP-binding protein